MNIFPDYCPKYLPVIPTENRTIRLEFEEIRNVLMEWPEAFGAKLRDGLFVFKDQHATGFLGKIHAVEKDKQARDRLMDYAAGYVFQPMPEPRGRKKEGKILIAHDGEVFVRFIGRGERKTVHFPHSMLKDYPTVLREAGIRLVPYLVPGFVPGDEFFCFVAKLYRRDGENEVKAETLVPPWACDRNNPERLTPWLLGWAAAQANRKKEDD